MTVKDQIKKYIAEQPEQKRSDMEELHRRILKVMPKCKLWYFDGKNEDGKVIANPTIGYGFHTIKYANGTTRDYFQIGLLANSTGISVHILGLADKTYLIRTFGKKIGKASVTGYCIKFKGLKDIDADVLLEAIRYGAEAQNEKA